MKLTEISRRLLEDVGKLSFCEPVCYVYNPLEYAWDNYQLYLHRYGSSPKRVIYLGMNPGPFGMAQTGIPFGDVPTVRDWLGLTGTISQPPKTHPKRPILGLDCPRVEVSGSRLWSWIRQRWATPEHFFRDNLILNYCPLVFLEAGGRNRTPAQLPSAERRLLEEVCDRALQETVDLLKPDWIIGVGNFARDRARVALPGRKIGGILHPSPASPAANRGWQQQVEAQLEEQGV